MTNSLDEGSQHTGDPRTARIEKELRRWKYLKDDDRPLARIIEDDMAEVTRLDMDLEELTARMKHLYDAGREGFGDPVIVDDTFEVRVREDRGIIACPFRDHYPSAKAIVEAVNLKTGKKLTFSILGWHLIQGHHFFQGKGSPFRIEPQQLHDFFAHS